MALLNAAESNSEEVYLQALLDALSDFYSKESDTNLEKLYGALANVLSTMDRDVSALRNDNVLSATITDEIITRGTGVDRLGQESAFEIVRVGFVPSTNVRSELHHIGTENTVVFLNFVPLNFDQVRIFNTNDPDRVLASEVIGFSEENNTVTVAGVGNPGQYVFEYVDVGNVTKEAETIQVPAELFQIGWSDGGFGNFGFGE